MDFVSDSLADGRKLRAFTVIDTYSRECLTLHVDSSLPSSKMTAELDRVLARRGKPQMITCDNGTGFTSNHFDAWAYSRGIALDFIRPGRSVENGHIESFNGRLRDEWLNTCWFQSLGDAKQTSEAWRLDYNQVRSHSRFGPLPPATYVAGGNP